MIVLRLPILTASAVLAAAGCNGSDGLGTSDSGTIDPGDPDSGRMETDGDVGGEIEDGLFMVVSRVRTPNTRSIVLNFVPNLDEATLDLSQGVEVSGLDD